MLNQKKRTRKGKGELQFLFATVHLPGPNILLCGLYIGGVPWKEHGTSNEELIQY